MRKFYKLFILFFIALFSGNVAAVDHGRGIMTPLQHERLAKPIYLNKSCKNIRVVEWRSTRGYYNSTSPSGKSIEIMNKTCNLAVNNFYRFIKATRKYNVRNQKFDTSLSLIPADIYRHGQRPRNLNDISYRFLYRSKDYDHNGSVYNIWGYHQRATNFIYIRNDVLQDNAKGENRKFVVVFAHELFHAMSYETGVFKQHRPAADRENIEEKMAQDFTDFLGLGR